LSEKARYATAHWLRFQDVTTPDQLDLSAQPQGAMSWKIGPSGPVGPDGYRLPGKIWCAVGLFPDLAPARAALHARDLYMPFVANTVESWHQLLLPVRHQGQCNYLDRECPGELFAVSSADPGGAVMVITTAGYHPGPKVERLIAFRRGVDEVNDWLQQADGCLASRPITPHTAGDDGFTLSAWRDDASMLNAMYRAGTHREKMDWHKSASAFDRSSFTRLRIVDTCGQWDGRDPLGGMLGPPRDA
jgi:hypothetical protein